MRNCASGIWSFGPFRNDGGVCGERTRAPAPMTDGTHTMVRHRVHNRPALERDALLPSTGLR